LTLASSGVAIAGSGRGGGRKEEGRAGTWAL